MKCVNLSSQTWQETDLIYRKIFTKSDHLRMYWQSFVDNATGNGGKDVRKGIVPVWGRLMQLYLVGEHSARGWITRALNKRLFIFFIFFMKYEG